MLVGVSFAVTFPRPSVLSHASISRVPYPDLGRRRSPDMTGVVTDAAAERATGAPVPRARALLAAAAAGAAASILVYKVLRGGKHT
jgi:hypothetical protein